MSPKTGHSSKAVENLELSVELGGVRLDKYVAERCCLSRSQVQRLIAEGLVLVEGQPAKPSRRLEPGEVILVTLRPPPSIQLEPEAIPLQIVYEDGEVLVIDKPAGLTVHPAPGHERGTLTNAIMAHYPELAKLGPARPGIVHRLDKDTSGLLVVAKSEEARLFLVEQLKRREFKKGYLALVRGKLAPAEGIIEGPVGRHPRDRKLMAVTCRGKEARTLYRVKEYLKGHTLLEIKTETGRTHQIRVHLSAIGYPIAGDPVYGVKSPFLKRQFLHAHRLGFKHPSGRWLEFTSELPADLKEALELIQEG